MVHPALRAGQKTFLPSSPSLQATQKRPEGKKGHYLPLYLPLSSVPEDKALILQGGRIGSFLLCDRQGYIAGDKVPPRSSSVTTGSMEPLPSAFMCLTPSLTVLI